MLLRAEATSYPQQIAELLKAGAESQHRPWRAAIMRNGRCDSKLDTSAYYGLASGRQMAHILMTHMTYTDSI